MYTTFLHEIVDNRSPVLSEKTALIAGDGRRWTFAELVDRSIRLAVGFTKLGVGAGDVIAVLARNRTEIVEVHLAASRIGAIHAPLNYRLSPSELLDVLTDCDPTIILYESHYDGMRELAQDWNLAATWVALDVDGNAGVPTFQALVESQRGTLPRPALSMDAPSMICYTGGSTGKPKGVVLSIRAVASNTFNYALSGACHADDVAMLTGALFHIGAVRVFSHLFMGEPIVVVSFAAGPVLDVMSREGVTKLVASGTIFHMLVDEMEARPRKLRLRCITTGAAPVPVGIVRRARAVFGCDVDQLYGQTEICSLGTLLSAEDYANGLAPGASEAAIDRLHSVGRPYPLTQVRVVDPDQSTLSFLPQGTLGEVVFGTPAAMTEYWRMPQQTAETLIDGWIRSGDVGYVDDDGYLFLKGRKKEMIISGGENVYVNEVELAIAQHPAVDEVAVVGLPDDHWGEVVHAVVAVSSGSALGEDELREHCRRLLAGYKVPKAIGFVSSLPKLTSGKIDRHQVLHSCLADRSRLDA